MTMGTYRPGVYSQYTVSSRYAGRRRGTALALVGSFGFDADLVLNKVVLGTQQPPGGNALWELLWDLCRRVGVGTVYAVSVPEEATAQQLEGVLALLGPEQVYTVACQHYGTQQTKAAAHWAAAQSAQQQERVVFLGLADRAEAIALAPQLNQERVVLTLGAPAMGEEVAHPLLGAAALALEVMLTEDPSVSLSNLELTALAGASLGRTTPQEWDALLEAGVSPLVGVGDQVECLRAVTTRTQSGGLPDRSLYPLSAILIIDYVMQQLRGTLAGLLKGGRQGSGTLSAVGSQVTVLLSELQQRGILTGYGAPHVYTPGDDPGRCVVEVSFGAAYTINQVVITAQVQL